MNRTICLMLAACMLSTGCATILEKNRTYYPDGKLQSDYHYEETKVGIDVIDCVAAVAALPIVIIWTSGSLLGYTFGGVFGQCNHYETNYTHTTIYATPQAQ